MDHKIVNRIFKGFGANTYGRVIIAIIQLAGVPILLYFWGARLYGEWLILFAIPAYLSMTDLGFSLSAANDMAARVPRGDITGALAVFQSLGVLVFSVVGASLLLITLLIFFMPLGKWLNLQALSVSDARLVLWLLAVEVLIKLNDGINHAGFRANGEYPLHVSINYSTLFAQHTGIWIMAALGCTPVGSAAVFMLVRAAVTPSVALLLVHRHRWLHFGFAHARLAELHALIRPAIANLAIPFALALNIQGMVLVVGTIFGPLAVVTFSTLRTLTRLALQMILSVSHAVEPEIAAAWGSGNRILIRTLYIHSLRAGLWLTIGTVLLLYVIGGWIVNIWTHGKVAMDLALFHWLLGTSVACVFWYGALNMLKAANRHLSAALFFVFTSGGGLVFAAALLTVFKQLSAAGPALLVMDSIMAAYTLRAAGNISGIGVKEALRKIINPVPLLNILLRRVNAL